MAISFKTDRLSLVGSSLLLVAVALVIVIAVIPSVKVDPFPQATPARTVTGLWCIVALQLLASAVFFMEGIKTGGRTIFSMMGMTVLGVLVLLMGYGLTDAAAACLGHGPQMHATAIVLFAGAAATYLSALIAISVAYLIPKKS